MLFDTHAHLNDERFDEDRDALIASFAANNVGNVCEIGTDIETSAKALELAQQYDFIFAVAGVYPHDTENLCETDMQALAKIAEASKVVAIGEIGLDYHYDGTPKDQQKYWFDRQLCLAAQLKLPVVIHTRDAMGDTLDILKAHKDNQGILHCYCGSKETARELLNLGYYLSFGGPLTFKNAMVAPEVVRYAPMDRILLETDSPYLAPVPYRGQRNNPILVAEVAKKIAEIREESVEVIEQETYANAKKAFGIV